MRDLALIVIGCILVPGVFAVEYPSVQTNMMKLSASDRNVRREAIDALYRGLGKDDCDLSDARLGRKELEVYLERWDENSYMAALLLGRLGQQDSIPVLYRVRGEANALRNKADEMDDRKVLAPRMEDACLKALVRLGDSNATARVRQLLVAGDTDSRAKGIECISYARRIDLVPDVMPLLDDTRDAVNIAPSGGTYYLRVCDVAVNAVSKVAKIELPFRVEHGRKYTKEQLNQLREVAKRSKF